MSDDHKGVYVWVDDVDENIKLSPHFDYEEDAVHWYKYIRTSILNMYGLTTEDKK
jgi:hypothetical protein